MSSAVAESANQEANQAFLAGDIKKAIDGYSRAIGADPTAAKYYSNRANAYLTQGKPQKAVIDADKASSLDGTVPKYFYRAAVALFELGRLEDAQRRIASLLSIDSSNSDAKALERKIQEALEAALDPTTAEGAKIIGARYLARVETQPGVYTTPSGLRFRILRKGKSNGTSPNVDDECSVHYHGSLVNGDVFDSSVDRGEPTSFAPNQVIPGWTEALQYMSEGEKWEVYLPQELAYGPRGAGGAIPPFSTLVFTIELLGVSGTGKPAAAGRAALEAALGKKYDELVEG
jgi:FKBP-type peptidyl-prolyl cis-trans isomerase FklB